MTVLVAHVSNEIVAAVDAQLGKGAPGDGGYYPSRSALIRAAIQRHLDELQPVATSFTEISDGKAPINLDNNPARAVRQRPRTI